MKKEKDKKENQITGNIGMYYACYKLSELGFNVMPTARNAKGVDIIAYTPDAKRFLGIQVKTVSKKWAVPLGKKFAPMGDFWIVVCLDGTDGHPDCFIMKPTEVRDRTGVCPEGDAWLSHKHYSNPKYFERWDRIKKGKS